MKKNVIQLSFIFNPYLKIDSANFLILSSSKKSQATILTKGFIQRKDTEIKLENRHIFMIAMIPTELFWKKT